MSKSLRPSLLVTVVLVAASVHCSAHNVGNVITWNREISRIIYQHCASCHHDGGTAFSLMRYQDVQPRAIDIKDAVLSRRMPPWGAVKGFGDFRNDQGLSQAELELITDWVDSHTPKGNNPNTLPKEPKFDKQLTIKIPKNAIMVRGEFTFTKDFVLVGLYPEKVENGISTKIVAVLPDGRSEPLV